MFLNQYRNHAKHKNSLGETPPSQSLTTTKRSWTLPQIVQKTFRAHPKLTQRKQTTKLRISAVQYEEWKERRRESLQAGMVRSRPRPRPAMGECAEFGRRRHRGKVSENERRSQYWTPVTWWIVKQQGDLRSSFERQDFPVKGQEWRKRETTPSRIRVFELN